MKTNLRTQFLLFLLAASLSAEGERSGFKPFVYDFDFESGSVGAWSSYPPAQDTAYDPTIWIKTIEGNSGLALVREIIPNYPIDYLFGVRKKLNIVVDKGSRLSFRHYVKNYLETGRIIIKFALADGRAPEIPIRAGKSGTWQRADLSLAEIVDVSDSVALEAVALMADCPRADPETQLKFAVDDVRLTGWRPETFAIVEPPVHRLEEFSLDVAGRHFTEGEDILIRSEFPSEVNKPEVVVTDFFRGRERSRHALRRVSGKSYEARIPSSELGGGLWRADIGGRNGDRKIHPETLVFLVRPKDAAKNHPWLLLTEDDRARLQEVIRGGRPREIYEKIKKTAAALRAKYDPGDFVYNLDAYDEVFWLPTYSGYSSTIRTLSGFARANGLVYGLEGDREAGRAAVQALLKMSEWPSFVHPHILNQGQFTYWPVGLVLIDLSLAYDLVYNLLTPAERQKIASALYDKGITEVFKEYVRDNRVSSDTSNWISHVTGGGILSALAVADEFSDKQLEPYLTGMILKVGELVRCAFDRDGNYGEGYAYHNFTMQTLSEIMPALENHFGIAFPEKVDRSHLYLAYQLNAGTKEIYDFGDTGNKLGPLSNFAYILNKTKDPLLRWLYALAPGDDDTDLIFFDPSAHPEPPATRSPLIRLFRDVGTAVFRSGFEDDDFLFVLRAGPFYNHQHFDQGTFFLRDKGEDFIVEGGKTDYYKDPWYQGFFIQAGGHNCILVDENPESQIAGDMLYDVKAWDNYARITDFLELSQGAFISSELAPIYKGRFKSLRRSILYLRPRTIVLIDRGEGAQKAARMNLRFHAPHLEEIRVDGRRTEIRRGKQTLNILTLHPAEIKSEPLKRPLSLSEFAAENPITMKARGFLQLTSGLEEGRCDFINILTTDRELSRKIEFSERDEFFELKVDGKAYILSRRSGLAYRAGEVETDAFLLSRADNTWQAMRASRVSDAGRLIVGADLPLSFVLEANEKSLRLRTSASSPARVQLHCPRRPMTVEMNGQAVRTWEFKDSILRLAIPEGGADIQVNW
jgi:hypothetical protein